MCGWVSRCGCVRTWSEWLETWYSSSHRHCVVAYWFWVQKGKGRVRARVRIRKYAPICNSRECTNLLVGTATFVRSRKVKLSIYCRTQCERPFRPDGNCWWRYSVRVWHCTAQWLGRCGRVRADVTVIASSQTRPPRYWYHNHNQLSCRRRCLSRPRSRCPRRARYMGR